MISYWIEDRPSGETFGPYLVPSREAALDAFMRETECATLDADVSERQHDTYAETVSHAFRAFKAAHGSVLARPLGVLWQWLTADGGNTPELLSVDSWQGLLDGVEEEWGRPGSPAVPGDERDRTRAAQVLWAWLVERIDERTGRLRALSISNAMLASGLTQAEVARRLGMTRQSVNRYVHGKVKPGAAMLARFGEAIGVQIETETRESGRPKAPGALSRASILEFLVEAGAAVRWVDEMGGYVRASFDDFSAVVNETDGGWEYRAQRAAGDHTSGGLDDLRDVATMLDEMGLER